MCHNHRDPSHLSDLGNPRLIWAIPAIHGETGKLADLHDCLIQNIQPGDRIVYMGNYMGYSGSDPACMDEILTFRRMVLSRKGMIPSDIVYLRGGQEEIWEKLLQLHFAPNPLDVLLWMLGNGLSQTLKAYDICPHDGIEACRSGTLAVTKWLAKIRLNLRTHPGHEHFLMQLSRAAYTDPNGAYPLLFVHAGLNDNKPLNEQKDIFWWGAHQFENIQEPYNPFQKVIRGYDPAHKGRHLNCISATLDDGCGFGGNLICTGFDNNGAIAKTIAA